MENILIWFIKNKTYVLGKDMKNCLFYGDKSLIFLPFIVFVSSVWTSMFSSSKTALKKSQACERAAPVYRFSRTLKVSS